MFSSAFLLFSFSLLKENCVNPSNNFREKEVGFEKEVLEDSKKEDASLHPQPN